MTTESQDAVQETNADEAVEESTVDTGEESTVEAGAESTADAGEESDVDVSTPEYQSFDDNNAATDGGDLARLQNVQIKVAAELGRATLPIQELMQLTAGSVLELDRTIDSPVDLIAQGVKLAAGEVVVVDGHFAIRILKVYDNK